MPAYTYCTTDLLERVIRCTSFNGGHLHSESASHPDVYPAAVVPCEHAARGCSCAILRSANLRYRYPALSPHSARRFLPHLRFPHSGVEDGERAPMRQVRRRGRHACRNVVRATGSKGAMGFIGPSLLQHPNRAFSTAPSGHHDDRTPPAQPTYVHDRAAVPVARALLLASSVSKQPQTLRRASPLLQLTPFPRPSPPHHRHQPMRTAYFLRC